MGAFSSSESVAKRLRNLDTIAVGRDGVAAAEPGLALALTDLPKPDNLLGDKAERLLFFLISELGVSGSTDCRRDVRI